MQAGKTSVFCYPRGPGQGYYDLTQIDCFTKVFDVFGSGRAIMSPTIRVILGRREKSILMVWSACRSTKSRNMPFTIYISFGSRSARSLSIMRTQRYSSRCPSKEWAEKPKDVYRRYGVSRTSPIWYCISVLSVFQFRTQASIVYKTIPHPLIPHKMWQDISILCH